MESTTSNSRYAVRNGDCVKGGATIESIFSNARHAVGSAVIGNCLMDGTISEVRVIFLPIWIIDGWEIRHLHSIRCGTAGNIVENAIY